MKRLLLYFHTSSGNKLAHISYLLGRHDLVIRRPVSLVKGYPELQVEQARESLKAGAEYVRSRFDRPFIIEDTEVRLEAYSKGRELNYPGFDVKRWWRVSTFEEIDAKCRREGTREASQSSHICLSIPGLPLSFFSSSIKGTIADQQWQGADNPEAPWLNMREFGSIFVPRGADRPFALLPLEASLRFDFRKKAVDQLAARIHEINMIINLESNCYSNKADEDSLNQLTLLLS